jgi:hypothetical protein
MMAVVTIDTRCEPPQVAGERATLTGFLQRQRDTLAVKCAGLPPAQLRNAPSSRPASACSAWCGI